MIVPEEMNVGYKFLFQLQRSFFPNIRTIIIIINAIRLNVFQYTREIAPFLFYRVLLFSANCHLMPIMIFLNRAEYRICVGG